MRSKFADVDLSLAEIKAADTAERAIREDIRQHRERTTISGKNPRAQSKSPWKVRDARGSDEEPPAAPIIWTWEMNEQNLVCKLVQTAPEPKPSIDSQTRWLGRKFRCRIIDPCGGPRGVSLAVGCEVECFAEFAFEIRGVGRGEILEEFAAT